MLFSRRTNESHSLQVTGDLCDSYACGRVFLLSWVGRSRSLVALVPPVSWGVPLFVCCAVETPSPTVVCSEQPGVCFDWTMLLPNHKEAEGTVLPTSFGGLTGCAGEHDTFKRTSCPFARESPNPPAHPFQVQPNA